VRVENDVLAVLSRAEIRGCELRLMGQLERKLYERTNKVLEAAGGKWNRKAKAHLYGGDAAEAMEQIILTGEVTIPQNFGYFPTPAPVVARLIELAEIVPDMRVLEPSAGQGAIAGPVSAIVGEGNIFCVELLSDNFRHLCELRLDGYCGDFLSKSPDELALKRFDRVVMNPPFAKQDDIRHVMHALKFLTPKGLLVSVMSAGVTFRENHLTQNFRSLINERGGNIEELPDGSFAESTTKVRAIIATIPGEAA
jgi:predicted RNA methylase